MIEEHKRPPAESLYSKTNDGRKQSKASAAASSKDLKWGPPAPKSAKKTTTSSSSKEYIPCLFLPCEDGGNKVVIYFHGNAEDIGLAFDLMYMFGAEM